MMKAVRFEDGTEGSIEGSEIIISKEDEGGDGGPVDSVVWQAFPNSKTKKINKDSFLYPILKDLNKEKVGFKDLHFPQVKLIFKGFAATDVVQGFYTAFRTVAWPLWWFGTGFISPGAIMFLGLFLLKLAIFATAAVSTAFLVLSTAFGVLNIFSNLFLNARNEVYAQVKDDVAFVKNMINELADYIERRGYAAHWMEEHEDENVDKLNELGGDTNDPERVAFENKLYVAMQSSRFTIQHYLQTNWYLNSPFLKVLNVINNVFNAINSRVLFGFGCFIFVMMTINIFFPLSMPVILTVIALALVSASIHTGLVARDMIEIEKNHATDLVTLNEKLNELEVNLHNFEQNVPAITPLTGYDYTRENDPEVIVDEFENSEEKEVPEEKPKSYLLDPNEFKNNNYYSLRFFDNLEKVAERTTKNPSMLDDFVHYASTAPAA